MGPMQARNAELRSAWRRRGARSAGGERACREQPGQGGGARLPAQGPAGHRLAGNAFTVSAAPHGVQLKSASYRAQPADGRIVRYEIVLPVAGSYPQIREFLRRSLAEISVLSLDQINLKRENRNDGAVNAELRLTLHMVKS
jgi:hypothetical protein